MNIEDGYFKSNDGLNLYYWVHCVPGATDTLFVLHGHGEHSVRYHKLINEFKDFPLNIAAYDFRGHGRSDGEPVYVDSYDRFIEDAQSFYDLLRSQGLFPRKPILYGHSNGALTAVHWMLRYQAALGGVFLTSPFLGTNVPAPLIVLNELIKRLNPHFVYKNPIYPGYLTHNREELERYQKDRLIRRRITANLFSEMRKAIVDLSAIRQYSFDYPIHILMSGLEKVVDKAATVRFYDKLECPAKDLIEYEEMYHEIIHELGQERVFDAFRSKLSEMIRPS